jgi:thiol:disulfide interchange protein DsbD
MIRWLFIACLFGLPLLGHGAEEGDLLEPEQAFRFSAKVLDASTVEVRYQVADGYYLYHNKFKFSVQPTDVTLGKPQIPAGKTKEDEYFGKVEIHRNAVAIKLPVQRKDASAAQAIVLKAVSQGCADVGVCYPPVEGKAELVLPAVAAAAPAPAPAKAEAPQAAPAGQPAPMAQEAPQSEESRIAGLFRGGSYGLVIASFFGFGLLLALTPCVFPMIPILSGIIVGQGRQVTKTQGFLLSLSYVLGMAVTYAVAGVAAGLSGSLLSNALQNPWVLGGFAAVFVLLAFSMFGFYELQLPSALQSRFSDASNRMKGGSLAGVFVMGVLSAVIVGPCVAAPLAGALLYIGQTHNVWLGGSALFAMAMGMGVPLLLVGLSAGALLPRAGGWMNAVKAFFGVLLLGVAIWLVSPVIPAVVHMLAWAALLIVSAIYLHALDPLPVNASGFAKFWKGVGVLTLVAGVAILLGALSGGRDILQPLAGLRLSAAGEAVAAEAPRLPFQKIKSVAELEQRLAEAKGRPVMLDFYADWCVSCKEFERFTFSDPRVQARLKEVVLLQADVTANSDDDKALLKRFTLFGPPGLIFFDREGREVAAGRVVGYEPADKFLKSLDRALN